MPTSRKVWGLAALALVLAVACQPAPEVTERAGRLYVQVSAEPVSLDPAQVEDGAGIRILANTMDGLVGYDGQGNLRPRLAESYQFSPDRKSLVFKLRADARWSDGLPVTAQQFVAGLERSRRQGSKLGAVFDSIQSARAEGRELHIALKYPAPFIVAAFTLPQALPLRPEGWSALGPATGDYALKAITAKQSWRLEANPYALTPPPIKEVELQLVTDEATAGRLFESGRLDVLSRVASLDLSKYEKRGVLRSFPYFGVYFLAWNTRKEPGNRVDFRRAFAQAIQKRDLVAVINGQASPSLREQVADSFIPPEIEGHGEHPVRAPQSKPSLGKLREIQLGYDSSSRNTLVAEKVQRDAVAVGIDLKLDGRDWKSYVARLRDDPPDLYRFGWLSPFRDPTLNLRVWTSRDPNNYSGWKNAEYDALVERIARMEPGPARVAKIMRAEEILISDEAVVIPLYFLRQTYAVSPRVKNFRANPFSVIRFGELTL